MNMADSAAKVALCDRLVAMRDEHVDFAVTCRGITWKVHKLVLGLHSKVLAAACKHGFKEGKEGSIDLSDHHPDCIGALVDYLYSFDYSGTGVGNTVLPDIFPSHVKMVILADKYDMKGLRTLAEAKFTDDLDHRFVTSEELTMAIRIAYEAPAATEAIRSVILTHVLRMKINWAYSYYEEIEQVMLECPAFAVDMVNSSFDEVGNGMEKYKCPSCGGVFYVEMRARTVYRCPCCLADRMVNISHLGQLKKARSEAVCDNAQA